MLLVLQQSIRIGPDNRDLLKATEPCLVLFTVSYQNCHLCNQLEVLLDQVASALPIYVLDCDSNRQICERFKITRVPLLALFKGGVIVVDYDKEYTKRAIEAFTQRIAAPVFSQQIQDPIYFVVRSKRPQEDFEDILLPFKHIAVFSFEQADNEQLVAMREGVQIVFGGKLARTKRLREFIQLHNQKFIAKFSTKSIFELYRSEKPLFLIIGRQVRDQLLLEQLKGDVMSDPEFYSSVNLAFLDLQEYAVYTEQYGVSKRQDAVSLVITDNADGQFYKEVLRSPQIVEQVREMLAALSKKQLKFEPFVENKSKQVKIGVGQSYTPPSETVGDRIFQVLDGVKNYDARLWTAILCSCGGMVVGSVLLVLGIFKSA